MMEEQYQGEEEEGGKDNGGGMDFTAVGRLYGWPSSRIVRVSRAFGGKDRHSRVLTSKGLRDRRVRLSVNTAIQFYDLQDRLGFDQPSKALEWLLKAAASSINELPPISVLFPDGGKQMCEEIRWSSGGDQLGFESPEIEMNGDGNPSFPTSETGKTSGPSISKSAKARERVAEKKENRSSSNPVSQNNPFTELLNAGIAAPHNCSGGGGVTNVPFLCVKSPMDRYSSGLLSPANHFPGFGLLPEHHHSELQQFSLPPDNLVHAMNNGSNEYNMNGSFSLSSSSSGFSGINRGTLQSNFSSNSPSVLPHIHRFADGSPPSFFICTNDENQSLSAYEARQQLCYSNNGIQELK